MKPKMSIPEAVREADKLGMSYGEYVAMIDRGVALMLRPADKRKTKWKYQKKNPLFTPE